LDKITLHDIAELTLSFKNIWAIENLQGFETSLVKLQLDNNHIQKIENLDHLVNLKWLDLSFNDISKIENLDKLVQLTDLSLFSNKITVIENLEKLTQLHVLSLGQNKIVKPDFTPLRKFRRLRLLNLQGILDC
jgi:Leucine-rich repeat (LRR) protein